MPSDVVLAMKAGSLETSAIAAASLSTMGSGVSLGAHRPYQELMLKSFRPTSCGGRDVGRKLRALLGGDEQAARPAGGGERQRRRPRIHEELDVARHQVGVGRRRALVEDGVERQAGALQEGERGDVSGRAARGQGEEVLLRLLGDRRHGAGIVGARHVVVARSAPAALRPPGRSPGSRSADRRGRSAPPSCPARTGSR